MLEYNDDVLGRIIINKVSDYLDINMEVTYNINLGFC
jgi:hypothetical protein